MLVAAAVLVAGCGAGGSEDPGARPARDDASSLPAAEDPGFGHVHGLGLNEADGAVYAATHYGVFRIDEGSEPVRVADRWQDTMGFTVAGPDLFFGSGHPDLREGGPPHLGLIVSRDGARTWRPVGLRGEADFHDLAVAGRTVYGHDATQGRVRVSTDGGRSWEDGSALPLRDLAVNPAEPTQVLATTPQGLQRSDDAARQFRPVPKAPVLLLVDWAPDLLAGVAPDGAVWVAADGDPAAGWEQRGRLAGTVEAFDATDDGRLLAADGEGVKVSDDGGQTWTLLAGYDDHRSR